MEKLPNETLENAISVYETTMRVTGDNGEPCYLPIDEATLSFLKELKAYREIGTVKEFKNLVENHHFDCEECAGCTDWLCDCANTRVHAIDEAIHEAAKAICIGCGYLKDYKCTYKGGNCGVSKPMLESVTEALEKLKNKDSENLKL